MRVVFKKALFLTGGICWVLFGLGFGWFLVEYVAEGAGLQSFGLGVSSGSVLIGLLHVVGLVMGGCLCFSVGLGLLAHGFVPPLRNCRTARQDAA